MKRLISLFAVLSVAGMASAASYSTNFEADTAGTLPTGWYLATPWGDWAPGTITAEVAAAPGGGQAMKVVWGTDWASYGASSGETGYTLDLGAIDPATATMTAEYDFYNTNANIWQMFGEQGTGVGNVHMNDDPAAQNMMQVNGVDVLTDVPLNEWIHVTQTINAATGQWQTTITYGSGSTGGVFSGTEADPSAITLMGQYWFGGWMFQSTVDNAGGAYPNELYIDNFSMSVVPEPASMLLLGLGVLALRRR